MEVRFSTGRYSTPITRGVEIETNEEAPLHHVEISAIVVPDSVVTSPLIVSGWPVVITGPIDSVDTEHSFEITNTSDSSLDLTVIDFPEDFFDIDLPSRLEPGQTVVCGVSIHPEALIANFRKSLTIELSDSVHTRFSIPVRRVIE